MPVLSDAAARTLARLGFAPAARVVILHADDLGMCLAENQATLEHTASGFATCGSIMAPCPWAAHIIRAARELPALDLGAHLTLNAEWADYRWSPLTGRDPVSGLVDGAGMMWASVADLHAHMDISAARAEMRAQVRYLLAQGVDLTHIDTHMGCILHPALLHTYLDLGFEFGLPVMVPRGLLAVLGRYHQPDPALADGITSALQRAEQADWPMVDYIESCSAPPETRLDGYLVILDALPPGITHLLYHAAVPGPEIQAIDRVHWALRAADYRVILDPALRQAIAARPDVHIIGYRELRALIRGR